MGFGNLQTVLMSLMGFGLVLYWNAKKERKAGQKSRFHGEREREREEEEEEEEASASASVSVFLSYRLSRAMENGLVGIDGEGPSNKR